MGTGQGVAYLILFMLFRRRGCEHFLTSLYPSDIQRSRDEKAEKPVFMAHGGREIVQQPSSPSSDVTFRERAEPGRVVLLKLVFLGLAQQLLFLFPR